jgi:hypothetical protein
LIDVVLDIDDTLISTEQRMQAIWQRLLDCKIPLNAIKTLNTEQIFSEFASPSQKRQKYKLQKGFWNIVLCVDKIGIELLKLDKPIAFAAEILQEWSKQCTLTYLTGRTDNTRDLTLNELKQFGFPIKNAQLVMFKIKDYSLMGKGKPVGPTLVNGKTKLFSSLAKERNIVRVIDDYPSYFPIYKQFNVPDRIGLLRSKLFTPQQYLDNGATRVIKSWQQLMNDPPKI